MRAQRNHRAATPRTVANHCRFDVVAIGTSAGGLHSLTEILRPIGSDFPSSILVVQHLDPKHKSIMTDLLSRVTSLRVKQAEHGETMLPGVVYFAPPDEHLLAGPGKLQLAHSQLVHFSRPSVDLLFESVAGTYGSRSVGVVLSGGLHDGANGIRTIKEAGGVTMAEDPRSAQFGSMPQAAIATGCVDFVLPASGLSLMLIDICAVKTPR